LAVELAQGKGWGSATVELEVAAALSLLPEGFASDAVFLDIGANIGDWTSALLVQVPGARVIGFEPSPRACAALRTRFAGDDRVQVVEAAVANETRTGLLWSDRPGSPLGSLSRRRLGYLGIDFVHKEVVAVIRLDDWLSKRRIKPAVVKMDIEGHELDALRGGREALRSASVIQFEFGGSNIDTRTYFKDFFEFFTDQGFEIFRLGPKGLTPVVRYRESEETFAVTNYFAKRI
jgi:FkbM family methyltransferase